MFPYWEDVREEISIRCAKARFSFGRFMRYIVGIRGKFFKILAFETHRKKHENLIFEFYTFPNGTNL
eukprot:UN22900